MTRMVIDTNVFVSSFFGGNPRRIIDLWKNNAITLCLSPPIIDEYIAVLHRLGLKDQKELDRLLKLFAHHHNALFIAHTPDLNIVENDPDDDKFIECAVALDCKIIISGDKHLKDIKKYITIQILSPSAFIDAFPL